jgi:hypothetical protein
MKLRYQKKVAIVLLASLFLGSAVWACQVPVFRYALERWNADKYRIVILNDGPLNPEYVSSGLLSASLLNAKPKDDAKAEGGEEDLLSSRVEVQFVDVSQANDPRWSALWKDRADTSLPVLAAYYPVGSDAPGNTPAYVASLTPENLQSVLGSPVREQIASNLVAGDSAVWIFLESGDETKDFAAYSILEQQLQMDKSWLKLPSPEELEVEPEVLTQTKIPLRIHFSIVRLKRDDKAESFLLDSLLNSEADLKQFDEPIAFPVFGRGRVLYALIGKGIAEDTIRTASSFMAGPCSCQVKNQNPGFDLLMQYDWNKAVGDTLISEPIESLPTEAPVLLKIPPGRASAR